MRYKVEFEIEKDDVVSESQFLEWLNFELGVGSNMNKGNLMRYATLRYQISEDAVVKIIKIKRK